MRSGASVAVSPRADSKTRALCLPRGGCGDRQPEPSTHRPGSFRHSATAPGQPEPEHRPPARAIAVEHGEQSQTRNGRAGRRSASVPALIQGAKRSRTLPPPDFGRPATKRRAIRILPLHTTSRPRKKPRQTANPTQEHLEDPKNGPAAYDSLELISVTSTTWSTNARVPVFKRARMISSRRRRLPKSRRPISRTILTGPS